MERFLVAVIIGIMLFTSILFTLFRAGREDLMPIFIFGAQLQIIFWIRSKTPGIFIIGRW
ncbi:hypothetical protein SAMN05428947_10477 [Mucilaginibacter sp. OK283]|jgi:hypothetical protein|nr:hypothetical protein SAMN05428947_10477 [Mucilaginibacter sp. OK283]